MSSSCFGLLNRKCVPTTTCNITVGRHLKVGQPKPMLLARCGSGAAKAAPASPTSTAMCKTSDLCAGMEFYLQVDTKV